MVSGWRCGQALASRFDDGASQLFNNRIFTICGDGDLMEGIAAGGVGRRSSGPAISFIDSNRVTIDGQTDLSRRRCESSLDAYGWHTLDVADANDLAALSTLSGRDCQDRRPSLIRVHQSHRHGSPHQDTSELTAALAPTIKLVKNFYGWPFGRISVPRCAANFTPASARRRHRRTGSAASTYKANPTKAPTNRCCPVSSPGWDRDCRFTPRTAATRSASK